MDAHASQPGSFLLSVLVVGACVVCGACDACGTSHGLDVDGAVDDGDVDAGTMLARPPPRPTTPDGADVAEVVFALTDIVLDQSGDRWAAIGFDQDGLVTLAGSGGSSAAVGCVAPESSATIEADGIGGTDNALGHQVLPLFFTIAPELESAARRLQSEGVGALVVRIRAWNGADDDPLVTADLFATADRTGDAFVAADGAVLGGADLEAPRLHDDSAYVADGVLVTRIADRASLDIAMGNDVVPMILTDAVLVVDLLAHTRRATLAGRWPVTELLAATPHLGVCPDSPETEVVTRVLNLTADIRSVPGTGGPTVVCDALSVGLSFTVTPATLSGLAPLTTPTRPCP